MAHSSHEEVMPPVVQAQVVQSPQSQKVYPVQPGQVAVPVPGGVRGEVFASDLILVLKAGGPR